MDDPTDRWLTLELRLAALLHNPQRGTDWSTALDAVLQQARALLGEDEDAALYWLLHVSATTPVGYSTAHALTCWALARLLAAPLGLTEQQADALERAALTMNIGMTALQDALAVQPYPPDAQQRALIDTHAARGAQCLRECGVRDAAWLHIVEHHHEPDVTDLPTQALQRLDRYAALLSPRASRSGHDVVQGARQLQPHNAVDDTIHRALVTTLGVCPPGSFVRLHDGTVAVVLRRSGRPAEPWVARVQDADGRPLPEPQWLDTSDPAHAIDAALPATEVRLRLPHASLLRLARQASMARAGG